MNYVKESRHKGIYVVWFYLHEILQHTKLINILKYQKSGCFRGHRGTLLERDTKELSGIREMLCILIVFKYQNSLNTYNSVHFIVKLYLNFTKLNHSFLQWKKTILLVFYLLDSSQLCSPITTPNFSSRYASLRGLTTCILN